jgi:hypothetical protein
VRDLADEAKEDLALVTTADGQPVILVREREGLTSEDEPEMQVCEYCGHYPCGCGG